MVLVTGGTGLVGSHLLYNLAKRGEKIRATKRESSKLSDVALAFSFYGDEAAKLLDAIEWVDADLMNPAAIDELFDGINKVFHCAAIVSFNPSDRNAMLEQNPGITANLINAALERKIEHFAYVSSVAAVGRNKDLSVAIDEKTEWKSGPHNSIYSVSKYLAELEVWRGIEEGLTASMINPTIILGPGNWNHSSNALFKRFSKHFSFYTTGANGFVDVRDVVDALIAISDKGIQAERFIIVGENLSFREITAKLAEAFGNKEPHIASSKWMTDILWRVEKLRSALFDTKPLITKETAQSARITKSFSNKKAQEMLGIKFRKVEESLTEFVPFYQKTNQA